MMTKDVTINDVTLCIDTIEVSIDPSFSPEIHGHDFGPATGKDSNTVLYIDTAGHQHRGKMATFSNAGCALKIKPLRVDAKPDPISRCFIRYDIDPIHILDGS